MPTNRNRDNETSEQPLRGMGASQGPSKSNAWRGEWSSNSDPTSEPFAQLPPIFFQHMTPEQWKAQQQVYQQAYERARAQVAAQHEAWEQEFQDFGGGI